MIGLSPDDRNRTLRQSSPGEPAAQPGVPSRRDERESASGGVRSALPRERVDPAARRAAERHRWPANLESIEHWVGEHPALCLGLALVMGVSVGWLIKRT